MQLEALFFISLMLLFLRLLLIAQKMAFIFHLFCGALNVTHLAIHVRDPIAQKAMRKIHKHEKQNRITLVP